MLKRCLLPFLCLAFPLAAQAPVADTPENRPDIAPSFAEQTDAPAIETTPPPRQTLLTDRLELPWAIAVLPGEQGYLVTERGGTLRHVARDGTVGPSITGIPRVDPAGQGGLLDIALANDFERSRALFLSYSTATTGGRTALALAQGRLSDDLHTVSLSAAVLFQGAAASAPGHYGSRILPLGDGSVLLSTGDRMRHADLAQERGSGMGAIFRIVPPSSHEPWSFIGEPPNGDYSRFTYSFGHRNVQGLARAPDGTIWAVEHGPRGGDELNAIEFGANYGWPDASYGLNYNGTTVGSGRAAHAPEFTPPRYYWDPVIAPAGMTIYLGTMFPEWNGDALIGGLRAQAVVRLDLERDRVQGEERLSPGIGRVRDVAVDTDGAVIFITDAGALYRLSR